MKKDSFLDQTVNNLGFQQLRNIPMPSSGDGIPEPSEIEIQQIINLGKQGRLSEISKKHENWFCLRLMPSLLRFGTYPPPQPVSILTNNGGLKCN